MNDEGLIEFGEGYTSEDEDALLNELIREYKLAKADYIRKKRLKGEPVDEDKMERAVNNRKKVRELSQKTLNVILGRGFRFFRGAQ